MTSSRLLVCFSWLVLGVLALGACKAKADKPLAPPDSYLLFVPGEGVAPADGTLLVKRADLKTAAVQPLPRLLETGFASEMLRTVYLAGQFLRDAPPGRDLAPLGAA